MIDYAPTLGLAAAGRVPAAGRRERVLPAAPATCPAFPALFPDRPPTFADADLLAVVQAVQRARGQRPTPTLCQGFSLWPERRRGVVPELDPYRDVRAESSVGPLEPFPPPFPCPRPRFFAYCRRRDQHRTGPARSRRGRSWSAEVFVRGADDGLKPAFGPPG